MLDIQHFTHAVRPAVFLEELDYYLSHNFQCNSFLLSPRIHHVSDQLLLRRRIPHNVVEDHGDSSMLIAFD